MSIVWSNISGWIRTVHQHSWGREMIIPLFRGINENGTISGPFFLAFKGSQGALESTHLFVPNKSHIGLPLASFPTSLNPLFAASSLRYHPQSVSAFSTAFLRAAFETQTRTFEVVPLRVSTHSTWTLLRPWTPRCL